MSETLTTHRLEVIRERVCNFLEVTQEGTSPRTIRFAEDCVVLLRALAAAEAELETLRGPLLAEAKAALAWRGQIDTPLAALDAWTFAKVLRVENALIAIAAALSSLSVTPEETGEERPDPREDSWAVHDEGVR